MKIDRAKIYACESEEGQQQMVIKFIEYIKALEDDDCYHSLYYLLITTSSKCSALEYIGMFNAIVEKYKI